MVQVTTTVELDRLVQLNLLRHVAIVDRLLEGLIGHVQVVDFFEKVELMQ